MLTCRSAALSTRRRVARDVLFTAELLAICKVIVKTEKKINILLAHASELITRKAQLILSNIIVY